MLNPVQAEGFCRPSKVLRQLFLDRYSCRAFLPTELPRGKIEEIFALAQRAPSWCNSQPWQLHVTAGTVTDQFRDGLYAYARDHSNDGVPAEPDFPFPASYTGLYQERRRRCGWQLYGSLGIARGDRAGSAIQMMENFRLFGAPHFAVVTSERDLGVYGAVDCGAFIGVLTLAATALGIGSIAQAAIAGCAPFVRQFFNLPDNRLVLVGISFGYPDIDHPANHFRTSRAALEEVIDWHG